MSFFAVLFALIIEQLKPLPQRNWVHRSLSGWSLGIGRNFDAGLPHHAWIVWGMTVLVPALVTALIYRGLVHYSLLLGLVWDVAILYVTLGFRQFSHQFTLIRGALEHGREEDAKRLLAQWRHVDASDLPRTELLRHVIEYSLVAAHRYVFGVFFWFILFSSLGLGPTGAVIYRLAEFASRYWSYKSYTTGQPTNEGVMRVAQQAFSVLDYMPARLTAFGFAVVGNFEDAVQAWRQYAALWRGKNEGALLSSAAGAVGIQLGGHTAPGLSTDQSKTVAGGAGQSEEIASQGSIPGTLPQMGHLRSVVGLVWRSVVLWMLLLILLTLANLIG